MVEEWIIYIYVFTMHSNCWPKNFIDFIILSKWLKVHIVDGFRQCFHYFCSILLFFLTQSVLKGNFSILLKVVQLFKHRNILKFTTYVWSFINKPKIEIFYKSKLIFIWIIIDVQAVHFNGVHGRIVNEGIFYSYLIYYVFQVTFDFWKRSLKEK